MALFGEVFGSNCPKYCQILLKFSLQVIIQGNKKSALRIFEKLKFLQKRKIPRVSNFGPALNPFLPLKMAEIKKKKKKKEF